MAVAHIKAAASWHIAAAAAIKPQDPRAARELLRAAERPGLLAELNSDEVRTLVQVLPEDEIAADALARVEESLIRERERTAALRARLDRRRGAPPS